jgi:hypothetical protein
MRGFAFVASLTRPLLRRRLPLLLAALALLAAWNGPARAAEPIEITFARIESADDGYRLSAAFSFELNRGLEEAISRGLPLYFTTDVRLTRPRWYWFDEHAVSISRTLRIDYNVLTRQYRAGLIDSVQQNFGTLDDALALLRRPTRWLIADKGALKPGETYQVSLRMGLDLEHLAKPFQVHALNNSDWRFTSDWKRFPYKAE